MLWVPMLPIPVSSIAVRAAALFAFWVVLIASGPSRPGAADLLAGAVTAAIATWVSLRLLPAPQMHPKPMALMRLAGHFLWQSVRAGVDVALRAFSPRLPLKTGTVTYRAPLEPGIGRDLFTAMTSLLPGTVPLGPRLLANAARGAAMPTEAPPDAAGAPNSIEYHCLDVDQPIVDQLDREATLLITALGLDARGPRAAIEVGAAARERGSQ